MKGFPGVKLETITSTNNAQDQIWIEPNPANKVCINPDLEYQIHASLTKMQS